MFNLPPHRKKLLLFVSPVVLLAVLLWVVSKSRPIAIPIHHDIDAPIAVSGDGRFVASYGSSSDRIQIFDRQTGGVQILRAQAQAGTLLFASNNKTLLVAGHSENASEFGYPATVQLWDVTTGTLQNTIAPMKGPAVALSADGHVLATGNAGFIELWSFPTGKRLGTIMGILGTPNSLSFSRDGNRLGAGFLNVGSAVYDVGTRKPLWQANIPRSLLTFDIISSAISPDGQILALGSQNGKVAFFDAAWGNFLRAGFMPGADSRFTSNPPDACRFVAFSPDGQLLASGGSSEVAVWNVATGKLKNSFPGNGVPAFSADGKSLYTGASMGGRPGYEVVQWRRF